MMDSVVKFQPHYNINKKKEDHKINKNDDLFNENQEKSNYEKNINVNLPETDNLGNNPNNYFLKNNNYGSNYNYHNNSYPKKYTNNFNNFHNNEKNFHENKYSGNKKFGLNYYDSYNFNHNKTQQHYKKNNYYSDKKRKPFTYNLRWDGYDPLTVKTMIYRAEIYLMNKYPNLAKINPIHEGFSNTINENSQYFIIKSFNEEDVHKAIKYSLWSSTKHGNKTLNDSFLLTKEKGGSVYLFFSCNGSGRYVGIAKMTSCVNEEKEFNYWTQDSKWPGLFDIEWISLKDVPFKCFKIDGLVKPISNARDTQEIPFSEAKFMFETIDSYTNTNSILEHFEFYDLRQENYEKAYL